MGEALARRVGMLLQAARLDARWSQAELAAAAGTSQQWISRVERGVTDLRLGRVEALFAVLGSRLVAETEARPDPRLRDILTGAEAAAELEAFVRSAGIIWKRLDGVPHAVAGRLSALAQGVPARPRRLDLLIAEGDSDCASRAFETILMPRWDDRLHQYVGQNPWLDHPAPRRWLAGGLIEMRISIVPRLPVVLTVTVTGYQLPVVPLTVLLETNPDVADLRRRSATTARQSFE
ncbi:helix-turn-helix domain-containing protein [Actinoplanes sp. CA-015351]|uniref:helix-turn-helix domain-containing protein n=1 Tax=Actinoplanes sp. CA-015351 TaxID=3239897 RepID=UPI003D992868